MTLASDLRAALTQFATQDRLLIALDFDGTLSYLVEDPSQSRPTAAAASVLPRLARHPRVDLALISGRPGATLAELAQPPLGTHLIGSHGAEIGVMGTSGFEAEVLTLTQAQEALLNRVRAELTEIAARHEGVWVEDKPASAALHTRPASAEVAALATDEALAGPVQLDGVVVLQGKSVVEIGVLRATKGDAITQLRHTLADPPVLFMGDDVTDEHAFAVLNHVDSETATPSDVGVKVGPGETAAAYRVADPDAVAETLAYLAEILENASA